jgi:hypothetical protein
MLHGPRKYINWHNNQKKVLKKDLNGQTRHALKVYFYMSFSAVKMSIK